LILYYPPQCPLGHEHSSFTKRQPTPLPIATSLPVVCLFPHEVVTQVMERMRNSLAFSDLCEIC
jgi:hypothetical protein